MATPTQIIRVPKPGRGAYESESATQKQRAGCGRGTAFCGSGKEPSGGVADGCQPCFYCDGRRGG